LSREQPNISPTLRESKGAIIGLLDKKQSAKNVVGTRGTYPKMTISWFESKIRPQDGNEEYFCIRGAESLAASIDKYNSAMSNILSRKQQERAVSIKESTSSIEK
jgi:hypothetical protein